MDRTDFTTDESMPFLLLLKEAGVLPAWLAEAPEASDVQNLPSVAFADSFHRRLPIHTKSAAYLSAVSAGVYAYPDESGWQGRLKAACASYGILAEVKSAHTVLSPEEYHDPVSTGNEKKAHALELIVEPGQDATPFYPIGNADEVEDSALKLARDLGAAKLPASWLVEAAENIVKAASAYGVRDHLLPRVVRELAEDRLPSPEYLTEQIDRRVRQAGMAKAAADLYKEAAADVISGSTSAADGAHFWELADRHLGIRYTDTVATPVASFRSGMKRADFEKMAGAVVSIGGVQVPFNAVTTLSPRLVAAALPRKIAATLLQAQAAANGLKAAGVLSVLDDSEQTQILALLTDQT